MTPNQLQTQELIKRWDSEREPLCLSEVSSILYLSLIRRTTFACALSGRKLIIFHFNSCLSFQRLMSSFTGILSYLLTTAAPLNWRAPTSAGA